MTPDESNDIVQTSSGFWNVPALPSEAGSSELRPPAGSVSRDSRLRAVVRTDRFLPSSDPDLEESSLPEVTETR